MGRSGYLIDSNAIIDFLGGRLPDSGMEFLSQVIDDTPSISIITKIEVLGYNGTDQEELIFKSFVGDSEVLGLSEGIIDLCIQIRKSYRIKLPDALIAATAINNDFILVTRNISDFNFIENLELINPHKIKKSN
ncbi:type II toxin-antitoxin system VapC family toxin [Gracilimonas sediminicola]|uniref:type II toxin-antitoxin system VapC family toxin n=1 Tax=Gracilimonas sediminicola TaxID=2952158 RepID=UPI0038D3E5C0